MPRGIENVHSIEDEQRILIRLVIVAVSMEYTDVLIDLDSPLFENDFRVRIL